MTFLAEPVWPIAPNWASPVLERLEWLTDVLSSPLAAEQRRALRLTPRRSIEMSVSVHGDARVHLEKALMARGSAAWTLPLFFDLGVLTAAAAAEATTLELDTRDREIFSGNTLVLRNGRTGVTEAVKVRSVSQDAIGLAAPTTLAWPIGTQTYPGVLATLEQQPLSITRRNSNVSSTMLRFILRQANPFRENAYPSWGYNWGNNWSGVNTQVALPDYPRYLDAPVINIPGNEKPEVIYGFDRDVTRIDNQTSVPIDIDFANGAFVLRQYRWHLVGRARYRKFLEFLYESRGRARTCWVPSHAEDFRPRPDTVPGSQQLRVAKGAHSAYGGPSTSDHVMVSKVDKTQSFHRIVGMNSAAGYDTILVAPALSATASPIKRACYMHLSRLDQDSIEIAHPVATHGASTALTTFRATPVQRVETPA